MIIEISNITNQIHGHKSSINNLLKSINNSFNTSNTWMIEGAKGIGKSTLLKLIATNILKIKFDINDQSFIHPDLIVLEKDNKKKNITVEEIRNLKKLFFKTSFAGGYRVGLIDSISDFNNFGHNAILKIIEEPPKDSFIFIINHQTINIPATIKSRCKIIKFNKLTTDEVYNILKNRNISNNNDELKFYSEVSNGSVGDAIYFYNNDALNFYKKILIFFRNLKDVNQYDILNFISLITNNKNQLFLIFHKLLNTFIDKIIKYKTIEYKSFIIKEEEEGIKYLESLYEIEKIFYIKDMINNNFSIFSSLNTDLHSTIYSLLITMRENFNSKD